MKQQVINKVMRRTAEDLLKDIHLFLLFLEARINQSKTRNMGNGRIQEGRWRTLQFCRSTFTIEIVQHVDEQGSNRDGVEEAIFGLHRPAQQLFDISHQPDAQPSWKSQHGEFRSLHEQMTKMVQQAKVIAIFGRRELINLAIVAPGSRDKDRVERGSAGVLLGNEQTAVIDEQIHMRGLAWIEGTHLSLGDVQFSKCDPCHV